MATYLRKAVVMGPAGTIRPGGNEPQDMRFNSRRYGASTSDSALFYLQTATKWARFWVHLPTLWPDRNTVRTDLLDNLDYQIAFARALSGVQGVILTFHYELPPWINGSTVNQRAFPQDLSSTGPWALAVSQFAARYNRFNPGRPYGGYSYIDILEPFNEPNLLAVQDSGPGGLNAGETVAFMMYRAKQIIGTPAYNKTPLIGGPCVHDQDLTTSVKTDYDLFTRQVLGGLANNGFYNLRDSQGLPYDYSVVWTMHNYNDVEHDHGSDTNTPDKSTYGKNRDGSPDPVRARTVMRSRRIADLLSSRGWKGWPNGTAGYPGIFITEGGADTDRLANLYPGRSYADILTIQSQLLQRNLNRLSTDDTGWGVGMMSNYLWYSAAPNSNGSSGLFDPISGASPNFTGGAPRPAYTTWANYPGRV
jgi:hypothetical protein